jgi:predicted nucleic-acid-binding protein
MIAVDTNVLLRYLLQDDEEQSRKAALLMTGIRRILVTDVVLVETVWVLTGKRYRLDEQQVAGVINALFEEPNIVFENSQAVWCALKDFSAAQPVKVGGKRKRADFPDALVVNKALRQASEWQEKLESVFSFDVAACQTPGMSSP